MIRAGERIYGIPSGVVEQVQEYKGPALNALYASGEVYWLKNRYPLHYLPRVLGDFANRPETKPYNSVILLKSGESRLAVHVDEVMRNEEVVLKPLGPQLAGVPGILGATVLPNGQAVLIVNPVHLAEMDLTVTRYTDSFGAEAEAAPDMSPTVLIVDDSLTVRKITSRLLSRQGYEVITAKDGLDALQQLQEIIPDVMLLDIEMPRMDGFELLKNVRSDARTAQTPIIMITSRTADKHRNHALELGANLFLGKPYQEELLLSHVAAFTGRVDPTGVGVGFASHVESPASLH
jgi:chemosensory pili system protein ChpA (sensor histidine kinase/response regulator)